jgi:hypothetical protein
LFKKIGAFFGCGLLRKCCGTCTRVLDFFGLFLAFFKKRELMEKNYAHKFYFLSAILKIYGKEE